jgi:L-amino acid N-acyltransferase YncA
MTSSTKRNFELRAAVESDAPAIARIYAPYVLNSCFTFEEVPPSCEEMAARMRKVTDAGLPYLVAEDEMGVVGYAYATPFHVRAAYRYTVENAVYVEEAHARRGIGLALMRRLIEQCTELGLRQMIARISESEASVQLHTRLGFRQVGHLPATGFKFGRWVSVTEMQLALGEGDSSPPRI